MKIEIGSILIFLPVVLVAEPNCGPVSEVSVAGDVCFVPVSVASFHQAELSCINIGGNLPSIHSDEVNSQLVAMGKKYFWTTSIWIGQDVRPQWLDGSNCGYSKWDNKTGEAERNNTSCGMLKTTTDSNFWEMVDCSVSTGFICAVSQYKGGVIPSVPSVTAATITQGTSHVTYAYGTPPTTPMTHCPFAPNKTLKEVNTLPCTMGSNGCNNWNILVMMALQESNDAKDTLAPINSFILQMSGDCSSQSEVIFMTPGQLRRNSKCEKSSAEKGTLTSVLNNIPVTDIEILDSQDKTEVIISMFDKVINGCDMKLPDGTGGILYFFTDVTCGDVCTKNMTAQQADIVDNMTKLGYNLRFIHVGSPLEKYEEACYKSVVERCWEYTTAVCYMDDADLATLSHDPTVQVCSADKTDPGDNGLSEGWIIGISCTAILVVIFCIGARCYFRYKSLSNGWRNFWLKQASIGKKDGGPAHQPSAPNDYSNIYDEPYEPDGWEIEPENLCLDEKDVLGSGAFATVYLAQLKGDIPLIKRSGNNIHLGIRKEADGSYKVAVKRLPPHATADGRIDFKNEINFMKDLGHHPHILSLLGVVVSTHNPLIVIENCENGDLLSHVRAKRDTLAADDLEKTSPAAFKMKDLVSIAWQISDGMNYLCSHNFIHRDIAARNILLNKHMVAKIADFGLCRLVDSSLYTAKGGRLPIKWMAPESLKYYEYSPKTDVWSFSVLLFEMFSLGEAPYQTVQPQDMPKYLEAGNRLPKPETCPDEIYQIMEECWKWKAEDRYSVDQIQANLTDILNSNSESYGYVSVMEQELANETCPI